MRRIKGATLALIGLFLGLSAGLGVVALKYYLVQEIVDALDDEVEAACDCKLSFDSFSLSFLRLKGRATNVRIIEKGVPRLWFDEITTDVDLSEIREKKIYLENLTLSRGTADGAGPDSVMFRFINQITSPLPPEKDTPDRWRAILNTLFVQNTLLREPLGSSEIVAFGTSMSLKRVGENYELEPKIADLRYRSFSKTNPADVEELLLGDVSAGVTIEDTRALFRGLRVGRGPSSASLEMDIDTDHGDQCTGDAAFDLTPDYIGLPTWLTGAVQGGAKITGTLGSPVFTGSLHNNTTTPFTLAFPSAPPIPLESLNADLTIDINHGDPLVTLNPITGSAPGVSLSSTRPLSFSDAGLQAGFAVDLSSFTFGPFTLSKAAAKIDVEPSGDSSVTKINVSTKDLALEGTSFGPAVLSLTLKDDTVDIDARTTDSQQGSLSWKGSIDIEGATPTLTKGDLVLNNFRYLSSNPTLGAASLGPIALTGPFTLKGPLDLPRLRMDGDTTVSFPATPKGMSLHGKTTLKDGVLTVSLPNSAYGGSAQLKVDLVKTLGGRLEFSLPGVPLSTMIEGADCGSMHAALDYSFALAKPLAGTGNIDLSDLKIGCAPYELQVQGRTKLPITSGNLTMNPLILSGDKSSLKLIGEVGIERGFNLSVDGDLHLNAFLPVLPALDNLRGLLKAKVSVQGPLQSPLFHGRASLERGEFGIHAPDIEAHNIEGDFILEGSRIKLETLRGNVNSGTFEFQGSILPAEIERSELSAHLEQVTIEPIPDSAITISGDFALGMGATKRQTLSGDISIDFAEIRKDFNLNQIVVNAISGFFLPSRLKRQSTSKPVDLDLDVRIHAARNIYAITPFFSAEMNVDIHASRSVSEPSLDGEMQILSGWVGLKGNRFDITSGALSFKPGNLTPTLSVAAEGSVRTPSGDNILVILEANGPLTAPRIVLSSDRALSQDELLVLITTGRSLTGRTLANRSAGQLPEDERFFFSKSTFGSIGSFFRSLSKIDVLSLEPMYNQWTGSIEPAIVAKKNLSSRMDLVGESLLGTVQSSRAGVVYNLTRSLSINGFIQAISNQTNNIVSSDLTYTILSEQATFLETNILGVSAFDERDILNAARLGLGSRVRNTRETLASIKRDILRYMHDQGFLDASLEVDCVRGDAYCRELTIVVNEGASFTIGEIVVAGDTLPADSIEALNRTVEVGDPATASTINAVERKLVIGLRNEGYIAARISPQFEKIPDTSTAKLTVTADIREPISFVFTGNTVFSSSEFLDSIDLFSRRRPFGNNTINLLVKNIEEMYQDKGYLFVQVSYKEDRSNPDRLTYVITINEEAPTRVKELRIEGNSHLTREQIEHHMDELGFSEQKKLLEPDYAIPDELDALRDILLAVFQQEGFTDARISYRIEPIQDGDRLNVIYTVSEGAPHQIRDVSISGVPSIIPAPPKPHLPTSYPKMNQYVEQVLTLLKDEGYLQPYITSDAGVDDESLSITVEPGPRALIGEISFEGLGDISEQTARTFITLTPGQPYRLEDINSTKRKLLRSGLFSRVEVAATDGAIDSTVEAITIRVVERPLDTLEVGTGANSEFGFHLFGEAIDKSLFQDGRSLSFRLDTYLDQARFSPDNADNISQGFASMRYLDPSFLDSDYTLTEEVRYQRQTITTQEYDLDRFLVGSYVFRPFKHGLSLTAGHSLALDQLFNVNPGAIIGPLDQGFVRLSFLSSVIKLDQRDDPLLPRKGYTMTLEPKLSMIGIGSEANFGSILARTTGVIPLSFLGPRFSLGLGGSAGFSQPWSSTTEIPITQRFYLGGRTTVRGYRENSLGPEGSDGAVIGGDTLLLAKSQLEYLLFDSFTTHAFFDAGNVWLRHESFNLGDIAEGAGGGFQYLSPIGPIGVDFGYPLDPFPGNDSLRVTFSVGSTF
jgi:outer membrane protein insertion porin family